jgi:hypothetical protein
MDNFGPRDAGRFVENDSPTVGNAGSLYSVRFLKSIEMTDINRIDQPSVPSHDYTDRRRQKLVSNSNSKNSRNSHATTSFQVTPPRVHRSDRGSLLHHVVSNASRFSPYMRVYRKAEEVVCPVCGNGLSNNGSREATAPTSLSSASSIKRPPSQWPNLNNNDAPPTSLRLSWPDNNSSEERPPDPIWSPSPLPINVASQVAETRCSICSSSHSESSDKYDTPQSQQPYTDGGYGGGDCVFCNDKDEQVCSLRHHQCRVLA